VAIAELLLLHMPPAVVLASVVLLPVQAVVVPVIAAIVGGAATVMPAVTTAVPQLLVTAYEMVADPKLTPNTTPPVFIDATAALLVLHVPPAVASVRVVVLPLQTVVAPTIGAAKTELTVTVMPVDDMAQVPKVTSAVYTPLAVAE
jgi:hypothetical protein